MIVYELDNLLKIPKIFLLASDLAWQAGIIDGEGTVTICRQIRKGRPSPAFRAIVNVTNTNLRLVKPFADAWGGKYYKRPDKRKSKKWKDSYTWHCPDSVVKSFLEALIPFLRSKRTQAVLLIDFIDHKGKFKRINSGHGSSPLGKEEKKYREKVWKQVRLLNEKGTYSRAMKGR